MTFQVGHYDFYDRYSVLESKCVNDLKSFMDNRSLEDQDLAGSIGKRIDQLNEKVSLSKTNFSFSRDSFNKVKKVYAKWSAVAEFILKYYLYDKTTFEKQLDTKDTNVRTIESVTLQALWSERTDFLPGFQFFSELVNSPSSNVNEVIPAFIARYGPANIDALVQDRQTLQARNKAVIKVLHDIIESLDTKLKIRKQETQKHFEEYKTKISAIYDPLPQPPKSISELSHPWLTGVTEAALTEFVWVQDKCKQEKQEIDSVLTRCSKNANKFKSLASKNINLFKHDNFISQNDDCRRVAFHFISSQSPEWRPPKDDKLGGLSLSKYDQIKGAMQVALLKYCAKHVTQ